LKTIVTRLALDLLRRAGKKREVDIGPWLPDPMPDLYLAHESPRIWKLMVVLQRKLTL
jgi:hypothetical protein